MKNILYHAQDLVLTVPKSKATISYKEPIHAAHKNTGSSFMIPKGRITAVMGKNGSGKTTLLKTLAGLLPYTSGKLFFRVKPFKEMHRNQRCRYISWCPAYSSDLWNLSVLDSIALGTYPHHPKAPTAPMKQKVLQLLTEFSLQHLAHKNVVEISSGERKKVSILRALMQDTDVLIFDEPIAHLDLAYQVYVMQYFGKLAAQGRTVICAMHNITFVHRFCEYILVLSDLKCIKSGLCSQIMSKNALDLGLDFLITRSVCEQSHVYYHPMLYQ